MCMYVCVGWGGRWKDQSCILIKTKRKKSNVMKRP